MDLVEDEVVVVAVDDHEFDRGWQTPLQSSGGRETGVPGPEDGDSHTRE
jgi:hypothetical protein